MNRSERSLFISLGSRKKRRAITLLEVMLALAILAGALAMLSQLVGMGMRAAREARDLTRGQILCESLMAEMTSGIVEPMSTQGISPDDPMWNYATTLEGTDQPGVLRLVVTTQKGSASSSGVTCNLVRLIRDPSIEIPTDETEEATTATEAATTQTETDTSTGTQP